METLLITHSACLEHQVPDGHPECPDRLRAVLRALEAEEFFMLQRVEAPRADIEALERVHSPMHVRQILEDAPVEGFRQIDPDTCMSPGTAEAALRAAGAAVLAVDEVMSGKARNVFCAVRPPGHHAEPEQAMGFCFFNNVAVGAMHARHAYGVRRIAVIDFDVHHGNGTQSSFENDPDLIYVSTHQSPLFPETGRRTETGVAGNIINRPMTAGAGSDAFRASFAEDILPRLREAEPEFIFISAGFDAHRRDPMANMNLTEADYGWATEELVRLADKTAGGRVVSVLEGGYDLEALAASARSHVRALMLTM